MPETDQARTPSLGKWRSPRYSKTGRPPSRLGVIRRTKAPCFGPEPSQGPVPISPTGLMWNPPPESARSVSAQIAPSAHGIEGSLSSRPLVATILVDSSRERVRANSPTSAGVRRRIELVGGDDGPTSGGDPVAPEASASPPGGPEPVGRLESGMAMGAGATRTTGRVLATSESQGARR